MSGARRVARALPPLSSKHTPGGTQPTAVPQAGNIGSLSPLTAQLNGGAPQGADWSYAYGGFLPRDPRTFTQGAFGPFGPILPVPVDSPPSDQTPRAEPRWWEYPVGWNLPVGQPGTEGLKLADFGTLKTLADLYSVARACIQLRKEEVRGLDWDIMPTKDAAKVMRGSDGKMKDFGQRRAEALKFFKRPDPDYFSWSTWLSALLEEIFVFDALALLMRPKWAKGQGKGLLGSDLDCLTLVDGPTIRPLVDMHGGVPRPPAPAYQQYLYGVPRTDLMTMWTDRDLELSGLTGQQVAQFKGDQLLYIPMVARRGTPYGFPPVERALIPVMSGLQKQGYQLDFFREGTVPAVYVSPGGVNANMTPNQIRELQDALNAIAGDPAFKHKIIVLPADSKVMPQKPTEIADQFDEIVMNQVCMAFDVSPMELGIMPKVSTTASTGAANQMAKASQGSQERKATKPLLKFLANIFNTILQDVCEQDDMQFVFEGLEEDEDEATQTGMLIQQIGGGLRSIDEAREELGLQPWGLPETSDPGWATPTGFIPLGQMTITGQPTTDQQPNALNPATAQPQGQQAPNGGPAKPTGNTPPAAGGTPAKPAPKKPSSGGSSSGGSTPGHAAAQGADQAGTSKAASLHDTPVLPEQTHEVDERRTELADSVALAHAHQARRDNRIEAATNRVKENLTQVVTAYQQGDIHLNDATDQGVNALSDGFQEAMDAASSDAVNDGLADSVIDTSGEAAQRAEQQRAWFTTLLYQVIAGVSLAQLNNRLNLYAQNLTPAYNQAYGTTAQSSGRDYTITWHLGATEHCRLCLNRDGQTYTFDSLPGWPGNGGFGGTGAICMGGQNCGCFLTYSEGGQDIMNGLNYHRPASVDYYQQQLQTIQGRRAEQAQLRTDFLDSIPPGAAARALTRDQLRAELADLENAQIRAAGGYPGVSVEPADIPADVIAELVPDWAKAEDREGLRKAVDAELEALCRHVRKGRLISTWHPKHISQHLLARVAEHVAKGLTVEDAVEVAKALTRRVLLNGQEVEVTPEPPGNPMYPVAQGGGGRVFPARDVNGLEVSDGRVGPPGGSAGTSPGNEPPRWAPPEGTSSGDTASKPRRRVRTAPPDEDDADYPESRARTSPGGSGPSGGAPSGGGIGSYPSPVTGIPGARKDDAESQVMNLMSGNFPPEALTWVDDATWTGPVDVPMSEIDFDDEDSWAAAHQSDRVAHFKDRINAGNPPHPVILVTVPGDNRKKVVDGHHRVLAYKALNKPVPAYVGKVTNGDDSWEETHSSQVHQGTNEANKGKVSKDSVNYRTATGARSCGNCVMFRPDTGSCTLVEGHIDAGDVCDEWAPAGKTLSPAVLKIADTLHKAGNTQALRDWYASGAGGGINWGGPGDLTACHAIASRYMNSDSAWGFCQERHIQATGKPNPQDD